MLLTHLTMFYNNKKRFSFRKIFFCFAIQSRYTVALISTVPLAETTAV